MEERREYEVLKIVRHGERCYLSSDRIRGMPLVWWLKYHTLITREQAFQWIKELVEDLSCFHQTKDNPCYQYVNPYSIIVGDNERWYLLDLSCEGQEELFHLMQRRSVREQFLPPDNQYYQKSSVKGDLYGTGKMIQYLLSVAAIEPKIGRADERRLRAIISRCLNQDSKNSFRDMTELSEQFSKIYPPKEKKNRKKWVAVFLCIMVVLIALICGVKIFQSKAGNDTRTQQSLSDEQMVSEVEYVKELIEEKERTDREIDQIKENAYEKERELLYDLVLLNFKIGNYSQCRRYLEGLKETDSFAKEFDQLCGYVGGETEVNPERELEMLLVRMEEEIPDRDDRRFDYCLLKGYLPLTDDHSKEEVKRLEEACISSDEWKEWAGEEVIQEMTTLSTDQKNAENEEEGAEKESEASEIQEETEEE